MKLFDLSDRIALITGGNGGIGFGMAEGLAAAGAAVMIAGRDEAKNAAAVGALRQAGAKAEAVPVDVTDEISCRNMVAATVATLGRLDVLVSRPSSNRALRSASGRSRGRAARNPAQNSRADDRAGLVPFHWPLEFPEVFDRDNPGFDTIVGNPPFAGKNTTIAVNAEHYLDWLQTLHEGAHGNSDIVAHFFRRAYGLLRPGGCLGLLATNTIRQGDTRATGLRPIRQAGGTIYTARRRYKWPGEAAVVVSVVHIAKGELPGPYRLDGREVPLITR
jgi:hypothetical protein